jgi:glycosyltransferase involved in cell wall biosynthesis
MPDPLRVLLVVPVGYVGGAENLFLNTGKLLPKFGIEPIYVCMRPGPLVEQAKSMGMASHTFREHRYRDFWTVWAARRWLAKLARDTGARIIHATHTAHIYSYAAARKAGIAEIWHLHDYFNPDDIIEKWIQRIPTSHVIFATHKVKTGFPHLAKFSSTVIQPTCVDLQRLRSTPPDPHVRSRFSLPDGPLILTVTRLQAYKGHAVLIDAAQTVLKQRPDAVFAIAGGANNPEQKAYLAEIQEVAKAKGVDGRLKFIGFVPDEALVNLYREATMLVHPALNEGFSVTVQEAMGMGVPAIVSDADGPRELVETWKAGVMTPKGDSAALATEILRILNEPEWARQVAETGRAAAEANPIEAMVERTANVYKEVAAAGVRH